MIEDIRETHLLRTFSSWVDLENSITVLDPTVFRGSKKEEIVEGIPSLKNFKFYSSSSIVAHLGRSYTAETALVGTDFEEANGTVSLLLETFPNSFLTRVHQSVGSKYLISSPFVILVTYGIIK